MQDPVRNFVPDAVASQSAAPGRETAGFKPGPGFKGFCLDFDFWYRQAHFEPYMKVTGKNHAHRYSKRELEGGNQGSRYP